MTSWWDTISEVAGDAVSFLGKNKGWIGPVVDMGMGLLNHGNQQDTSDKYYDAAARAAQADYDRQKLNYDAYVKWNEESQAARAANAAARRAAAAAALKARKMTEAERQKALKRARKIHGKGYKEAKGMYAPFVEAGKTLVPKVTATYGGAMDQLLGLQGSLITPERVETLKKPHEDIWEMNPRGISAIDWSKR